MFSFTPVGRHEQAFSLIEHAVVASVIATLALVLAQPISARIAQSRISDALTDCHTIATAIARFRTDTGRVPGSSDGFPGGVLAAPRPAVEVLVSEGPAMLEPRLTPWSTGRAASLIADLSRGPQLQRDAMGPQDWQGPYLFVDPGADPWGHRYAVNIGWLGAPASLDGASSNPGFAVFVLSAGPNGIIETPFRQPLSSAELKGDDIGVRIQ